MDENPEVLHKPTASGEEEPAEESAEAAAKAKGKRKAAVKKPAANAKAAMKKPASKVKAASKKKKLAQIDVAMASEPPVFKRKLSGDALKMLKKRTTFAGRRRPDGEVAKHRFEALKEAYFVVIAPKFSCPSQQEVRCFINGCFMFLNSVVCCFHCSVNHLKPKPNYKTHLCQEIFNCLETGGVLDLCLRKPPVKPEQRP